MRIGNCNGLRTTLGSHRWASFVKEAREKHYEEYLRRFGPSNGTIKCAGPLTQLSRSRCPNESNTAVHLHQRQSPTAPEVYKRFVKSKLKQLHLDHEFDVKQTCALWKANLTLDKTMQKGERDWATLPRPSFVFSITPTFCNELVETWGRHSVRTWQVYARTKAQDWNYAKEMHDTFLRDNLYNTLLGAFYDIDVVRNRL